MYVYVHLCHAMYMYGVHIYLPRNRGARPAPCMKDLGYPKHLGSTCTARNKEDRSVQELRIFSALDAGGSTCYAFGVYLSLLDVGLLLFKTGDGGGIHIEPCVQMWVYTHTYT